MTEMRVNDMGGEWKYDNFGRKYREIGKGCIEYATTITIDGVNIYEDEIEEFNRRQAEAKKRKLAEQRAEMEKRPPARHCPFSQGMNNDCKREKCALFHENGCSVAVIAGKFGADSAENNGGKCPFSIYARCEKCALNNKGCAIVRLAASTMKGD